MIQIGTKILKNFNQNEKDLFHLFSNFITHSSILSLKKLLEFSKIICEYIYRMIWDRSGTIHCITVGMFIQSLNWNHDRRWYKYGRTSKLSSKCQLFLHHPGIRRTRMVRCIEKCSRNFADGVRENSKCLITNMSWVVVWESVAFRYPRDVDFRLQNWHFGIFLDLY